MSEHHLFPPIEALTLTPEQAAILDLTDRVAALEAAAWPVPVVFKSIRGRAVQDLRPGGIPA